MKFNNLKSSIILLSLSLIGLIVFVLLFLPLPAKETKKVFNQNHNFHFANPNNIDFYETAYKFEKKKIDFENKNAVAGIIPHHLLAADLIAEFFSNLENFDYEIIILIGPNHFSAGDADIITSAYDWQTPYGILEYDQEILNQLLKFDGIKIEESIFQNEHSINSEVAFIKKTFPNAKLLPIVLKPSVDEYKAEKLAEYLFKIVDNEKILILASVDFSHYKNSATAQMNDKISINAIQNFSFDKIYDLDIDSPASIYALLKFSELSGANFELLNNTNSAILANKPEIDSTTSYVTGYFFEGETPASRLQNLANQHLPNNLEKSVQMLFFGDMMLDRHVGERIDKYGLDYIFEKFENKINLEGDTNLIEKIEGEDLIEGETPASRLQLNSFSVRNGDCFFQDYDIISCNLEGAVTDNGAHYNPIMAYDFAFAPELILQLKDYGFNFFNLANNHFSDQGERGIIETRENLDKMGFDYVGCRDSRVGECSSKILEIAGKKIGMAGFSMVYGKLNIAEVEKIISNLSSVTDLVIVNMHWGVEYKHQFNNVQQKTAHSLIDAGADVIIGHHPHVVQGVEVYKSKPIFYSLGNFVFDQYFSQDTQEGLAVGISTGANSNEYFLYPIKSKLSQVELMDSKEKEEFLRKLISWSEVKNDIADQIKESKISL